MRRHSWAEPWKIKVVEHVWMTAHAFSAVVRRVGAERESPSAGPARAASPTAAAAE